MELIGGPTFLEIYNAAKTFQHPCLDELRCKDQLLVSHDVKQRRGTPTCYKSLSDTGSSSLECLPQAMNNMAYIAIDAIKDMVEAGAQDVLDMSNEVRMVFWKNNMD